MSHHILELLWLTLGNVFSQQLFGMGRWQLQEFLFKRQKELPPLPISKQPELMGDRRAS